MAGQASFTLKHGIEQSAPEVVVIADAELLSERTGDLQPVADQTLAERFIRMLVSEALLCLADRSEELSMHVLHTADKLPKILSHKKIVPGRSTEVTIHQVRLVVQVFISAVCNSDQQLRPRCGSQQEYLAKGQKRSCGVRWLATAPSLGCVRRNDRQSHSLIVAHKPSARMLELARRLGLNLADSLARDVKLLTKLLERVVGVHADARANRHDEAPANHLAQIRPGSPSRAASPTRRNVADYGVRARTVRRPGR